MLVLLYQIKVFIYDKYMPQQFTTIFQAFTLGGGFFLSATIYEQIQNIIF